MDIVKGAAHIQGTKYATKNRLNSIWGPVEPAAFTMESSQALSAQGMLRQDVSVDGSGTGVHQHYNCWHTPVCAGSISGHKVVLPAEV